MGAKLHLTTMHHIRYDKHERKVCEDTLQSVTSLGTEDGRRNSKERNERNVVDANSLHFDSSQRTNHNIPIFYHTAIDNPRTLQYSTSDSSAPVDFQKAMFLALPCAICRIGHSALLGGDTPELMACVIGP